MLLEKLQKDLIEGQKARQEIRVSVLRLTLSALNYEKIEKQHELNDEEIIAVLQREAKKRREAIESFKKAQREDLWQKEEKELEIIQSYLPRQLSEEEVKTEIEKILLPLAAEDRQNFGKAMSMVMPQLRGKAEGNLIAKAVKDVLSNA